LQAALDDARQKLADTFKALSADALRSNNQAFLDLAKTALWNVPKRPPAAIWNCASKPSPIWCGQCANRSKRSDAKIHELEKSARRRLRGLPSRCARCSKPKRCCARKPASW
jgi:DNA recombination protein RmuC